MKNSNQKTFFMFLMACLVAFFIVSLVGWFAEVVVALERGKVPPPPTGGGDDDHGNQSGNDPLNRFHLFLLFMTGWRTNGGGAG